MIELPAFDKIELDPSSGTVTAGAGVSLDQILRVIVPDGFPARDAWHSQCHGQALPLMCTAEPPRGWQLWQPRAAAAAGGWQW